MKVQIIDEKVMVYSEATETSNIFCELHADDEIDMSKSIKNGDSTWFKVTTPDGKIGYISAETQIFKIGDVRLDQASICVLNFPDANSKTDTILKEGDKFTIICVLTEGGNTFLKIRLNSGEIGFLPGNTMINDGSTSSLGRKLFACLLLAFGIFWLLYKINQLASHGLNARDLDITNPSPFAILGIMCLITSAVIWRKR